MRTEYIIPLVEPKPDANQFIDILAGKTSSRRVPLVEYIVDDVVMKPILEGMMGRRWVERGAGRDSQRAHLENVIAFWYRMGYDFVRFEESLPLPEKKLLTADSAPQSSKDRAWTDEHNGAIMSWEDFETYPWPKVEEFDFYPYEYLSKNLPEGMGLIACHGGGLFEHLSWIMSLEGLSFALHENPELVRATAERLGNLMTDFYRNLLGLDHLIAVFPGDDMGYKSATMISPKALRTYVLPWHRKFAAMTHEHSLPYFLHSCGNVVAIMEDLIADVRIDGKHSFEDAILPVQEFQQRYGDRIAVLGGLDLNILSGGTDSDVREHVRFLLEVCGGRGRYAVGSGNSIPTYVPVRNYLAMLDETHRHNASHEA